MGKTCIVTGANSGIGRSTAITLAKNDYTVFATMRSLERGEKLKGIAQELNLVIKAVELDVSDTDSVNQGINEILDQTDQIDVLINNAGVGSNAVIEDVDIESDKSVFETNFWGVVRCIQAVLPTMRQQKSGHIIQVSSIAGRVGLPAQPIYSASKWALEGLSENLAHDLSSFGVRVSIIEPGVTRTAILGKNNTVPQNDDFENIYARMLDMYMQGIEANIRPEAVSETILQCLESSSHQLRWPVAWGAETMVNARHDGSVSDEEWVEIGSLVNNREEWVRSFRQAFNL
ncbi:MAG: SDR family oxidoreductase [Actinomycetota bacterium]|nr:SDR family oxidoreductase [Actinomycetota bacterium]MEC7117475.1 SDR family oxidoreductase [Actinomycetota bacterium]MEC8119888.1 SDR family oxidoreductase [Actinomycetota bacterium]MEC8365185.1 SDR family oxidoreductase [Actinomycetota bacterium]